MSAGSPKRLCDSTNAAGSRKNKRRKYVIPPLQPRQATAPQSVAVSGEGVPAAQQEQLEEDVQLTLARALRAFRRRRGCLRVTDLTAADWCQVQACFKLQRNKQRHRPSAAMLAGTARHRELEEELFEAVVSSAPDLQQVVNQDHMPKDAAMPVDPAGASVEQPTKGQLEPAAPSSTQPQPSHQDHCSSQCSSGPQQPPEGSPCRTTADQANGEEFTPLKLLLSPEGPDMSRGSQILPMPPCTPHTDLPSPVPSVTGHNLAVVQHSMSAAATPGAAVGQQTAAIADAAELLLARAAQAVLAPAAASPQVAAAMPGHTLLQHRPMSAELVTREDWLAAALLQCAAGLKRLLHKGLAREVYVFGRLLEGFASNWIVGVADELRLVAVPFPACTSAASTDRDGSKILGSDATTRAANRNGAALHSGRHGSSNDNSGTVPRTAISVLELKTRRDGKEPQPAMRRQARLQAMLYKQLLDCLPAVTQQPADFFRHKRVDAGRQLCPDVAAIFAAIAAPGKVQHAPVVTLSAVMEHLAAVASLLPSTSSTLTVRWESQVDKSIIMDDVFAMDPVWLEQQITQQLAFVEGRLPPLKVSAEEQWKCERCRFAGKCAALPYASAPTSADMW